MKLTAFISLFALLLACNSTKKTTTGTNKLNGTWVPVSQEMGGKLLPEAFLKNQKLIISDSNYTVVAESVDKGIAKYNGDKMDIYGKDGVNAGKHFTAIYKFENEILTICYNLTGDNYPSAFDTKGKPMYFLSVFKKG
ncbi:MAG: TIGR03067 domain-containing protein [Bacteroidota bacterium]